jgi:DUF1680 family protein
MKKYKLWVFPILIAFCVNTGCVKNNDKELEKMPQYLKTTAIDKSREGSLANYLVNMNISGQVGEIFEAHTEAWVTRVLEDNPGLFDGFLNPSNPDIRKAMWHGEFPGKILSGIAQMYLTSKDRRIYEVGNRFVEYFKQAQREDGYLGPWPEEAKFNNDSRSATEGPWGKWDTWGHYHCIHGLYRWYQVTGNEDALEIAEKALDCIIDHFITNKQSFASQKWGECNFAISHMFALMYDVTGKNKYLKAAEYMVNTEWKNEYLDFYTKRILSADWLNSALEGVVFGRSNQTRWESLYTLSTLGPLYKATGDETYLKALDSLWWGMAGYDRHNIGSFGTGEGANANPYGDMSETCNTVAWAVFSTEYLKVSKNSYVADELEMSFFNAILGSLYKDNRVFSYANYSNGQRDLATITLEGHSYAGARDMSCCQASGTKGLASITEWAILTDATGLYLNYYGESKLETFTNYGNRIKLNQQTVYPKDGYIKIIVEPEQDEEFSLHLRIPVWSEKSKIKLNGKPLENVNAGTYHAITRKWEKGDSIEIELDMSLHFWVAEKNSTMRNRSSIYYGPLLLGVEENDDIRNTIKLDYGNLKNAKINTDKGFVYIKTLSTIGKEVTLVDFAHLGKNNSSYFTWINVDNHNLQEITYDRNNTPVWCNR